MSDTVTYVQTQVVPLAPVPSQSLAIALSNQPCKLNVYQKSLGVFLDLLINDVLIVGGVICQNGNPLIRDVYL
jgi:hypothetical protein